MNFFFTRWLSQKFHAHFGFLRAYPIIISGTGLHCGEKIKLLYIGKEVHLEYWKKILFAEYDSPIELGKTYCWQLQSLINRNSDDFSLIIIESSLANMGAYLSKDDYFIPLWLNSTVPLPLIAKNKSAKSDVSLLNKNKLTYHVSNDIAQAEYFYKKMYLPYVSSRFAKGSVFMKQSQLLSKMENKKAEILYVSQSHEILSGVVVDYESNIPKIWSIGVLDGEVQHLRLGVVGASYYYLGKHLFEKGYLRANFGYCRAFYNDGVFILKRKWGITIEGGVKTGFLLKNSKRDTSINSFLKNNPFVYFKDAALHGVTFIDAQEQPAENSSTEYKQNIKTLKKLQLPGVKSVCLVALDKKHSQLLSSDECN